MRKALTIFMIAVFMGLIFGYLLFRNINENVENIFYNSKELTLFQTGVFFKKENADSYANTFKNATVVKEGDFYHVYIAILNNPQNINMMKEYFDDENINYYLRKIHIKENNFTAELLKYESILLNSKKGETIDVLNEMILKTYKESI